MEQKKLKNTIETEEELRSIIGFPSELVIRKAITDLDHHCYDFISKSLFLLTTPTAKAVGFLYT